MTILNKANTTILGFSHKRGHKISKKCFNILRWGLKSKLRHMATSKKWVRVPKTPFSRVLGPKYPKYLIYENLGIRVMAILKCPWHLPKESVSTKSPRGLLNGSWDQNTNLHVGLRSWNVWHETTDEFIKLGGGGIWLTHPLALS